MTTTNFGIFMLFLCLKFKWNTACGLDNRRMAKVWFCPAMGQKGKLKMEKKVLEMVTQCLMEMRMHDFLQENDDYKRAVEEEVQLYERFLGTLSEGQREEFEKFLVVSNESALICEKLSYQQGMKDLMALFRELCG